MDHHLDRLDVHLRALGGFPDESDRGSADLDPRYATVELVARLDGGADDARFVTLRRSLADLLHLETRLGGHNASDPRAVGVASSIAEYERALARPRFGSIARQTERLLVLLETALTAWLSSPATRSSHAVKLFFGYDAVRSHEAGEIVKRCLLEASGESQATEQEAMIGCGSVVHQVHVDATTTPSVLAWKFAFDDTAVDLSVVFSPSGAAVDAEVDPYSEAAVVWNTSAEPPHDEEERVVLQYSTRYSHPTEDGGNVAWIYGACRVPSDASGVVIFEWADAGETTIFSKALRFQTQLYTFDSPDRDNWGALTELLAGDDKDAEDTLAWLEAIVSSSQLTTWPTEATESLSLDDISQDGEQITVSSNEDSRQKDLQIRDLQSNLVKLEEELQAARQELKTTKSELEISSEIYKASLETIAQLESAPARTKQSNGMLLSNGNANYDDDDADSYGDDDEDYASLEEDEAEEEPADGETMRLRDLVATFQEQCLWRSIETSESEKRNLLLEAELNQLDQDKRSLVDKLAVRDQELAVLQAETQKLKAQKAVLVKEVKRLQPYSQVNLSSLIREAEEARMMQRSLQAQLQALTTARTPETDHPVAATETIDG